VATVLPAPLWMSDMKLCTGLSWKTGPVATVLPAPLWMSDMKLYLQVLQ
jgi:hypothetical protein